MEKYRTLVGVLSLAAMLLIGLVCVLKVSDGGGGVMAYSSFSFSVAGLGALLAGKSLGEKLAGGGGIKGAVDALLTSKKPEPSDAP